MNIKTNLSTPLKVLAVSLCLWMFQPSSAAAGTISLVALTEVGDTVVISQDGVVLASQPEASGALSVVVSLPVALQFTLGSFGFDILEVPSGFISDTVDIVGINNSSFSVRWFSEADGPNISPQPSSSRVRIPEDQPNFCTAPPQGCLVAALDNNGNGVRISAISELAEVPPPRVPEPATLMLVASGLAGMASLTRIRRRRT